MTTLASTVSSADVAVLRAVRARLGGPRAVAAARGLSVVGEHAGGWCLVAATGALLRPDRQRSWVRAGAVVLVAHASSVVLKRVVRRPRPDLTDCRPLVTTPGRFSFPSSHATSTTAAALALTPLLGGGLTATAAAGTVLASMGISRVLLGVHYPTDVLAGCALGSSVVLAARWVTGPGNHTQ